jgi:hypothetical protein
MTSELFLTTLFTRRATRNAVANLGLAKKDQGFSGEGRELAVI